MRFPWKAESTAGAPDAWNEACENGFEKLLDEQSNEKAWKWPEERGPLQQALKQGPITSAYKNPPPKKT